MGGRHRLASWSKVRTGPIDGLSALPFLTLEDTSVPALGWQVSQGPAPAALQPLCLCFFRLHTLVLAVSFPWKTPPPCLDVTYSH